MKVFWYEISIPGRYNDDKAPIAGWQDSLQEIVMKHSDIELYIAFEGRKGMSVKCIDNVTYIPIIPDMSVFEQKVLRFFNPQLVIDKILPQLAIHIKKEEPDIIQVFGTEWGACQIQNFTNIPVVVHMMGAVGPYLNALLPPNYSVWDKILTSLFHPVSLFRTFRGVFYNKRWKKMEQRNFEAVSNYMGRTSWDKGVCEIYHPNCNYYYCSEALRPSFVSIDKKWSIHKSNTLTLVTVGCSTHWKGMDVVLKTAKLLKRYGVNFKWKIVGRITPTLKREIEFKEKANFSDNDVDFLGYRNADELLTILLSSDMYIHTAYIDNSPNTICEAQYLGMPIIATYVGGIPSLLENGVEGILVPANDSFTLAYEIISLSKDYERQQKMSLATCKRARKRHDVNEIYRDLSNCYLTIINKSNDGNLSTEKAQS